MSFLSDFLHQEAPKSGNGLPAYYRRALVISEAILSLYFLAIAIILALSTGQLQWLPIFIPVLMLCCFLCVDRMNARENLFCVSALIAIWLAWYVHAFGWTAGSPNILVPILSLVFFNIYIPPLGKIAYALGLILFRVLLFAYSLNHAPSGSLNHASSMCLQVCNSVVPLVILSLNYILFSSSIQASERQLALHNQELHKEAGTDPLTGLSNRRAILDVIEGFRRANPDSQFSIAIADIDFFKKINDTYGHNCGDYTLMELSRLFLSMGEGRYSVSRWGGEEFCFFLPGLNVDQASIVMQDVHRAVRRLPLRFGETEFAITITVGVEEYDFQSPTEDILDRADRKLYMGKVHGRDQVVA